MVYLEPCASMQEMSRRLDALKYYLVVYLYLLRQKWAASWQHQQNGTKFETGIRPVWSEPSLSAWKKLESLATHWAHSEDSDPTGRMPRLIWVFAGCTVILMVLSWGGSNNDVSQGNI